jgi:DNA-directed RNA polymerase specialized sigma subunit
MTIDHKMHDMNNAMWLILIDTENLKETLAQAKEDKNKLLSVTEKLSDLEKNIVRMRKIILTDDTQL